jgi:hypothetical protein
MTSHTKVCFLITFALIAFGTMCSSQTVPRDSVAHYFYWLASFTAIGGAAFITSKFKAME